MNRLLNMFREVWIWDSEYIAVPGFHVTPVCMSAIEMRTGATVSRAFSSVGQAIPNPMSFGPDALHVCYMSTADLGFALAAGWGLPHNVLDPWVEYRNLTNGAVGITEKRAQAFIEREKRLYPIYQAWLDANDEDRAFNGYVETEFGFRLEVPIDASKSLRSAHNGHLIRRALNHPMQGNCAEIMRYASCLATERGIDLGCTIHDAVMYTAPADCWQDVDALMLQCMNEACEAVLSEEFVLKSDRDVVHFPDHYQHEDAKTMWDQIQTALTDVEAAKATQCQTVAV